jgi:fructuronate reductase
MASSSLARLSRATLSALPAGIGKPRYDPGAVTTGIVHFGPGAFHRAHQAHFIERLLERDPRWGIAAVSLRTADTVDALAAQDGLYTLAVLDSEPSQRIIGAHSMTIGPGEGERLHRALADPAIALVTSTVTEKGYCLDGDGALDMGHPDIVHDRAGTDQPRSLVGWLVAGLAARRADGTAPFAVLCCDNMAHNGRKLRDAALALARLRDPALADWIADRVAFPDTMVDSITPASDAAFLADIARTLGVEDRAAVQREGFAQWVVGRYDAAGGPDLAAAGVTITDDVAGYERAKLRILNGTHSTIAYLGLSIGHQTVFEAMRDAPLAGFVERFAKQDIVAAVPAVSGLDLGGYADAVLGRYRNPAIRHLLSQIASDGSQKLPYRIVDTLEAALAAGRSIDRVVVPLAAWMAFIQRSARAAQPINDPLADTLAAIGNGADGAADLASRLLAIRNIFPARIAEDPRVGRAVEAALADILDGRIDAVLAR